MGWSVERQLPEFVQRCLSFLARGGGGGGSNAMGTRAMRIRTMAIVGEQAVQSQTKGKSTTHFARLLVGICQQGLHGDAHLLGPPRLQCVAAEAAQQPQQHASAILEQCVRVAQEDQEVHLVVKHNLLHQVRVLGHLPQRVAEDREQRSCQSHAIRVLSGWAEDEEFGLLFNLYN